MLDDMDYPAILRAMMDRGLNQTQLAKRLKVKQPTISRWLDGAKPKVVSHERIMAEARQRGLLGSTPAPAVAEETAPAAATVPVVGYVGAGTEAHFYAVSQGELDRVEAPKQATGNTVAVEVKGDSLGSFYRGVLIFYDDVRRPVTPDLIGRICVVGLDTGKILVKRLCPGRQPGLFNLESDRDATISDAAVEWAARVKLVEHQ